MWDIKYSENSFGRDSKSVLSLKGPRTVIYLRWREVFDHGNHKVWDPKVGPLFLLDISKIKYMFYDGRKQSTSKNRSGPGPQGATLISWPWSLSLYKIIISLRVNLGPYLSLSVRPSLPMGLLVESIGKVYIHCRKPWESLSTPAVMIKVKCLFLSENLFNLVCLLFTNQSN